MGSFCTPSYSELPSSSDTYSADEVPSWVSSAGRSLFEKASEIAASDYPTYSGDRIATYGDDNSKLTDQEREGMGMLGSMDETFQPYLDKYEGVADTLGQGYDAATREELLGDPFSMDTAQPFMDIYQGAMDPAVREIEEQTIRSQNEARSRAARGGGAFGSRLGIMEGTAAGEGAQAAGDLRARAGREGLDFAAGRFDTERANRFSAENAMRTGYETDEASRRSQMDAYGSAGTLAADLQAQTAQGLITSGEATRLLDQRALDLAYADYLDQREYPAEQLNFALGALAQTPYSKASRGYQTGTQMSADPSVYGQTLSGLGSLYSAYKLMNPTN
jgi:hypothetical protein|tara:strand:+ start:148 stop:1149 length:1002 start_codon:yes stop_codon:yes gene_type:complete